jgi:hypothetical protein
LHIDARDATVRSMNTAEKRMEKAGAITRAGLNPWL